MGEVTTSGNGSAEHPPDQADLSVSYGATGADRNAAAVALTRLIAPVEALLERPGVQVRSRRLTVHSNWERGRHRRSGSAQQHYDLRVVDLDGLEDLVAELVATEPQGLYGPSWGLSSQTEVTRQAQREAVADARERATGLAEALGLHLGALLRITDSGSSPMLFGVPAAAPGGGGSSYGAPDLSALRLTPTPVSVSASCTATWQLV
jgi:uncharacterized protein YggE